MENKVQKELLQLNNNLKSIEIVSKVVEAYKENSFNLLTNIEQLNQMYKESLPNKIEILEDNYKNYKNTLEENKIALDKTNKNIKKVSLNFNDNILRQESVLKETILESKNIVEQLEHNSQNIKLFNETIVLSKNSIESCSEDFKSNEKELKNLQSKLTLFTNNIKNIKFQDIKSNLQDLISKLEKESKIINSIIAINTSNGKQLEMLSILKDNIKNTNEIVENNVLYIKNSTLKLSNFLKEDIIEELSRLKIIIKDYYDDLNVIRESIKEIKQILNQSMTYNNDNSKNDLVEIKNNLKTLINQNKAILDFASTLKDDNKVYEVEFKEILNKWAKENIRNFAIK